MSGTHVFSSILRGGSNTPAPTPTPAAVPPSQPKPVLTLPRPQAFPHAQAELYPTKNSQVGRLIRALLGDNMDWVFRREESHYPLTDQGTRRQIKLDVDIARLREIASKFGYTDKVPIPVGWLKKDLERSFSVTVDGVAASRFTRNEDSHAAYSVLLDLLPQTIRFQLSTAALQQLAAICFSLGSEQDTAVIQGSGQELPPLWQGFSDLDDSDIYLLNRALQDDEFRKYLMLFTIDFLPLVEIDLTALAGKRSCIITYELVSGQTQDSMFLDFWNRGRRASGPASGLGPRLSAATLPVQIAVSGAMGAQREHLRVHLPPGMQLANLPLISVPATMGAASRERIRQATRCSATSSTVVLYRDAASDADYAYRINIVPKLGGFFLPAALGLAASALCLVLLALSCWIGGGSTFNPAVFSATASVWLLGSSLVTGWATLDKGETLRRGWLAPLRSLVLLALCLTVIAGLVTAVFGPRAATPVLLTVWLVAALADLCVLGLLCRGAWIIHQASTRLAPYLGKTREILVVDKSMIAAQAHSGESSENRRLTTSLGSIAAKFRA